ncbi:fumarylacetoacetate hydrolase family protein [Dyadobacter sandarakinus]|uniref:Fumarylacetoacetate hydrolase family protein n=1 Tax=Dyadobacter sandarakinus TaxID=2747268 RepID=A0ABX7I276_9BACT|nr:fumarylacetoacetate hydrolase family protein [Dyadobacter sandarakinus]QRR00169.1 fumarylacetoacetate hydrolase family protein [Dyadobacter sandarakinus]
MNKTLIGLAVGGLLSLLHIFPAHSSVLSAPDTKDYSHLAEIMIDTAAEISIFEKTGKILKAPEDALTLARFDAGGQVHTLAVLQDNGEMIRGIDLSAELGKYEQNAFEVIKGLEFDEIVKLTHTSAKHISLKYADLLPSVGGETHLAIGINYAEHGKETGQVRPFMFPKFVRTDPAVHQLQYTKGWLLDHEAELGIVFPKAVCSAADLNSMMIGFLVVNDFTDRATLMRKMDSQNVIGGKGFPDAKSNEGFLPTGPYMVVPRNWRAFVNDLELSLSVNGEQRQHGSAKDMVWDISRIIEQSLSVKGEKKSYYQGQMVKLFEGSCIPANTIIMTGTPSGVVFNAPGKGFIIGTVFKYIFTGAFFTSKMHPYILEQYLKNQMKNTRYLKPGDKVETSISYLGTIHTSINE